VPALTCVQLPLRALGRRAAELVLDTPPHAPIHEIVQEAIVIPEGGTVAPPGPARVLSSEPMPAPTPSSDPGAAA
jgi:hypothetical protein